VSIKGGVGKTRISAGLGTVYGMYRTEPVIALDANPTYGNLGRLIDPDARSSIREFIADAKVTSSYPMVRYHTGKNKQGLEVLAGNQNLTSPFVLDADTFADTLARTQRFYQLSLIDCGHEIEHPVMSSVFEAADALVIVGALNFDGVGAAEQTLDWLDARNKHDLLRRSALVLNDVYRCQSKSFVAEVRNSLGPRVGDVKIIPWDRHLRDGAVLDFEALRRRTQLAYAELAAWLAQGFAADAPKRGPQNQQRPRSAGQCDHRRFYRCGGPTSIRNAHRVRCWQNPANGWTTDRRASSFRRVRWRRPMRCRQLAVQRHRVFPRPSLGAPRLRTTSPSSVRPPD
jgi:MinD-like ATPase involved in chromosome partitioning or flagellar assembly